MPITVYTGQPGNGKTSFMMRELLADVAKLAKGDADARPIYAAGIEGLDVPGVVVLDDPRRWNDKDESGEYLVPDGAKVYVDEAWKWFGHLQDASRQATPKHVLDLAEHRHRGLDFVWTTQMPNQLFPFVRGLIGRHTHCVRRFGTQFVDLFTWGELQEDVKSAGKRELADRTTATLPKEVRDKYRSATIHTVKARLPWKLYALPALVVVVVVCAIVAYKRMQPEVIAASAASAGQLAGTASGQGSQGGGSFGGMVFATAADFIAARTPRIESIPSSAPLYDGRSVQQYPEAYCVISGPGRDAQGQWSDGGCHCYTQQITRLKMHPDACRVLALERGDFDPYRPAPKEREARQDRGGAGSEPPAVEAAPAAALGAPASGSAEQVAAYGWFRDQKG